jgi:hypothetical protein
MLVRNVTAFWRGKPKDLIRLAAVLGGIGPSGGLMKNGEARFQPAPKNEPPIGSETGCSPLKEMVFRRCTMEAN